MKLRLILLWPILAIFLGVAATPASAEVYKWKDKEGNVHFSQSPRDADSASETYDLQYNKERGEVYPDTGDKKTGNSPPTTLSPEELVAEMEKSRLEEAHKAEETAKLAAEKKDNCAKAQKRMIVVQQGGRVYEIDKNGERLYWDDATRKAKEVEAQGFIDSFCDP